MKLGYLRHEPRWPAADQEAMLRLLGVTKFWTEDEKKRAGEYPARTALARAIRSKSDEIYVSDFHRLGNGVEALAVAVRELRAKHKAVIIEARTGRRSDCTADLADMMAEAQKHQSQRGLSPEMAREMGRKGGDKSPATKPRKGHIPLAEINRIMNDHKTYPNVLDAIAAVKLASIKAKAEFWPSRDTIYRWNRTGKLKFRERKSGRKLQPENS